MQKIICDGCSKESNGFDFGWNKIQIPCHIADEKLKGHGYIDSEGGQVSGRLVPFDLCNKCANLIYQSAYEMIKKIQVKTIIEQEDGKQIQKYDRRIDGGSRADNAKCVSRPVGTQP